MKAAAVAFSAVLAIGAISALYQAHEAEIEGRWKDFAECMFFAWLRGVGGMVFAGWAIWG